MQQYEPADAPILDRLLSIAAAALNFVVELAPGQCDVSLLPPERALMQSRLLGRLDVMHACLVVVGEMLMPAGDSALAAITRDLHVQFSRINAALRQLWACGPSTRAEGQDLCNIVREAYDKAFSLLGEFEGQAGVPITYLRRQRRRRDYYRLLLDRLVEVVTAPRP